MAGETVVMSDKMSLTVELLTNIFEAVELKIGSEDGVVEFT